jgi:hypothetical protein
MEKAAAVVALAEQIHVQHGFVGPYAVCDLLAEEGPILETNGPRRDTRPQQEPALLVTRSPGAEPFPFAQLLTDPSIVFR